jgi:hypothetical protein
MRGACVGECEACKFIDMCYKEKTITGLTKLCLFGYTDTYAELTPTWCTNDCNRICAKLNKGEYGSVVDTTSAARYSNQAPGITDCCSCATYGNPSSYQDRVKNPVEAGLCVDVYPFSFNDCQQFEPTSLTTQICDIMQKFCGVRESEQSGAQKYKNFVNCIEVFKACSTTSNLDLTIDKALPQGIDVPPELLSAMSQGNITMESMTCGIINSLIETR